MQKNQELDPALMYPTLNYYYSRFIPFISFHGDFSNEECKKIIEIGNSLKMQKAGIGGIETDTQRKNENIRDSNISWIEISNETVWIFEKLRRIVTGVNEEYFKFDLYGFFEAIQFTKYEAPSGKYSKHIDVGDDKIIRKLSITIQLSDPNDYEGGDLLVHCGDEPAFCSKKRGSITIFPSYMLHEVTPVTKGTRYSLVTWIGGPAFR